EQQKPRPSSDRSGPNPRSGKARSAARRVAHTRIPVRPVRARPERDEVQEPEAPPQARNQLKIEGAGKGRITITIEIDGQGRPARGSKPLNVYKVDLDAIQEKGDVRSNYQLFPGDRLIIGRNEVVKKTIEIDRLNAPLQAIVISIQQNTNMLKALGLVGPDQG